MPAKARPPQRPMTLTQPGVVATKLLRNEAERRGAGAIMPGEGKHA